MLEASSPLWSQLRGGYRTPYDPRPAIQRLGAGDAAAWDELWQELHHQGDLGEASYVAVPLLVALEGRTQSLGWRLYALLALVETERHRKSNPLLPEWLASEYHEAWQSAARLALAALSTSRDPLLIQSALSVVALAKGQARLGALIGTLDASEIEELTNDRLSWAQLYRNPAG
jgi:hypothetical protein